MLGHRSITATLNFYIGLDTLEATRLFGEMVTDLARGEAPAKLPRKKTDDFVALTADGLHYIVETKGLEDTNVANKDRAAQLWCDNATKLAGKPWAYLKVLQTAYKQLQPTTFEDLFVLAPKKLL